jgi:hypothetical protein
MPIWGAARPRPFEGADGGDLVEDGVELGDDAAGAFGFGGQVEGAGALAQQGVIGLDDAEGAHRLARGGGGHGVTFGQVGFGAELPLQAVSGVHGWFVGGPGEAGAWAVDGTADGGAQRQRFGGHCRFGAPDDRVEVGGEVQLDAELAGGQADGALEPAAPLVGADGVAVLDRGRFPGVEGNRPSSFSNSSHSSLNASRS